jgi:hypothetical protein
MTGDCVGTRTFQTWKTTSDLPPDFAFWRSTVVSKNPDFTHTLWGDAENRAFIAKEFPWFLSTYDGLPGEIYRVDCVRYFYLYVHGGFYLDLDTECLRSLSRLADHAGVLLGRMGAYPEHPHSIPNAIMGSRPREEFWLLVIGLIGQLIKCGTRGVRPEYLTGPVVLKSAADIYLSKEPVLSAQTIGAIANHLPSHLKPRRTRSNVKLLPPREWYPIDWTDPIHQGFRKMVLTGKPLSEERKADLFPRSSLVTYWSHCWETE